MRRRSAGCRVLRQPRDALHKNAAVQWIFARLRAWCYDLDGLVIGLAVDRKRRSVLAAVGERVARRVFAPMPSMPSSDSKSRGPVKRVTSGFWRASMADAERTSAL